MGIKPIWHQIPGVISVFSNMRMQHIQWSISIHKSFCSVREHVTNSTDYPAIAGYASHLSTNGLVRWTGSLDGFSIDARQIYWSQGWSSHFVSHPDGCQSLQDSRMICFLEEPLWSFVPLSNPQSSHCKLNKVRQNIKLLFLAFLPFNSLIMWQWL